MSKIILEDIVKDNWGTALWMFFHIVANKIKSDSFDIIRYELIQNIKYLINNIFCYKCRKDATEYLENNNFMSIENAIDFKMFFFNFHNNINIKLEKELFLFENLDSKYNEFNLFDILKIILQPNYIIKGENQLEIINAFEKWFYNKMHHFNN